MGLSNIWTNPNTREIKLKIFIKKCLLKAGGQNLVKKYEQRGYRTAKTAYEIQHLINGLSCELNPTDSTALGYICNMYRAHRFDILGSGWVDTGYHTSPLGRDGHLFHNSASDFSSKTESECIWRMIGLDQEETAYAKRLWRMIDNNYEPIDWHRDLKSGYWWGLSAVDTTGQPGAEIKAVWDLGRMYHLPQLALYSIIVVSAREDCVREFKNQVLNFMAVNPVSKGIHWECTMDVAIRAANLLVAYDIFQQHETDGVLPVEFHELFLNNIYLHGLYIEENLEVDLLYERNANHYLANLMGLLFISAYLGRVGKARKWWDYAREEFLREVSRQFMDDGTNIEASTAYHRLSGEFMVFGAALLKRVDGSLPNWLLDKIVKAGHFSKVIHKKSRKIVQIGDNDSGRLFKFTPQGRFITAEEAQRQYLNLQGYTDLYGDDEYFDEDILNHETFISAICGIAEQEMFADEKKKYPLEARIVQTIAGSSPEKGVQVAPIHLSGVQVQPEPDNIPYRHKIITEIIAEDLCFSGGKWHCYPDFGLYCYKNDVLDLYVYAGRAHKKGITSHMHNDLLSYELCVLGKEYFSDPGTYLYTALPEQRNRFRSRTAHNVPDYGFEPNPFTSVFAMTDQAVCHICAIGFNHIELLATFQGITHKRRIEIFKNSLQVTDWGTSVFTVKLNSFAYFSNGYGRIERSNSCQEKIVINTHVHPITV